VHLHRKAAAVVPAPEDKGATLPPIGNEEEGVWGTREGVTPALDHLPDFSFVLERLCNFLLLMFAIFVPALALMWFLTPLLRGIVIGVMCVLPTTVLVRAADGSAHTKWFCGEITVMLLSAGTFTHGIVTARSRKHPIIRWVGYSAFAVSIVVPLLLALCRRGRIKGDKVGVRCGLLLLTACLQVLF
jgi:hypothetical protein